MADYVFGEDRADYLGPDGDSTRSRQRNGEGPQVVHAQSPDLDFAEALSELPDIARAHGRNSLEVERFIERHKHLPEFEEFAEECLRLEFSTPSQLGYAPRDKVEKIPRWFGYVASTLVATSLISCVFGFYSVYRWAGDVSRDFNLVQRDRKELRGQLTETKSVAEAALANDERGVLRERVSQLGAQLATAHMKSAELQGTINRLESRLAEQSRSLVQLESERNEREALQKGISKLQERESQFYSQFKATDRLVNMTLATNIQAMIIDAGLLRMVVRAGQSDRAIDHVRKVTKSDIASIRAILADVPRSTGSSDPETSRTNRDIEAFCASLDRFAADHDSFDPLAQSREDVPPDEVISVALLSYAFKQQLHFLQLSQTSSLIRDVDYNQHVQRLTRLLEESASKSKAAAFDMAPTASIGRLKSREAGLQRLISVLRPSLR